MVCFGRISAVLSIFALMTPTFVPCVADAKPKAKATAKKRRAQRANKKKPGKKRTAAKK